MLLGKSDTLVVLSFVIRVPGNITALALLLLPLFTNFVERLSEKGASDALSVDLAGIRRPKWTVKALFRLPLRLSCGPLWGFSDSLGRGILGSSRHASVYGIMLVVERNAPLELKRFRKEDKPCPSTCSRSPTTLRPGPH